jgi:hypothetical protein
MPWGTCCIERPVQAWRELWTLSVGDPELVGAYGTEKGCFCSNWVRLEQRRGQARIKQETAEKTKEGKRISSWRNHRGRQKRRTERAETMPWKDLYALVKPSWRATSEKPGTLFSRCVWSMLIAFFKAWSLSFQFSYSSLAILATAYSLSLLGLLSYFLFFFYPIPHSSTDIIHMTSLCSTFTHLLQKQPF